MLLLLEGGGDKSSGTGDGGAGQRPRCCAARSTSLAAASWSAADVFRACSVFKFAGVCFLGSGGGTPIGPRGGDKGEEGAIRGGEVGVSGVDMKSPKSPNESSCDISC